MLTRVDGTVLDTNAATLSALVKVDTRFAILLGKVKCADKKAQTAVDHLPFALL